MLTNGFCKLCISIVDLDIECFNPEEHHPVALLQLQLLHKDAVPVFLVITGCSGLALSVYGKMGLKRMAKEVLGKVMEKPWDAEDLE
ncbi:hypothetical protein CQW23_15545 [Capsicum baccatum]|uniref:Uncharacterized protein n=1 Tax=Capsicum baccatum TaxID=33114 RepID=A0A2G2WMB7_CAPBA|nr:hypothetical protein CQW23_15545 [Capsicum baccatum]